MIFSLTIPDVLAPRIIAGLCGLHNYQSTIPDPDNPGETIPNPETKAEFIRKLLLAKIKRDVLEYEGVEAQRAAMTAGGTEITL